MKHNHHYSNKHPNPAAEYYKLARQALARYGLDDYELEFLRHNENVTYKVERPQDKRAYALRLHEPKHSGFGRHGRDWKMVRSELLWMEALKRDTGLYIPLPLRNLDGQLVTRLERGKELPILNCSILTWLDGEPVDERTFQADQAARLGEILARMHEHTRQWKPPDGFVRPKRDMEYFRQMHKRLGRGVDDGIITKDDYAALGKVVDQLEPRLQASPAHSSAYGLIHADVIKGNLLTRSDDVCLLDFSLSCYAPYTYDLAVCLADQDREHHAQILSVYNSRCSLPPGYEVDIEGYMLGSLIASLVFMLPRKNTHAWIKHRLPQIVRDHGKKFIEGVPYWFPLD